MAPEQALELPNVDHRADVWAFCVVLYEALSGTLPFSKPTFAETLCALVGREAAPLTAIGIDPALWQIIERGLRKAPEERWQSMHELGTALASWLMSRAVTVDVTGAALHTQWPVPAGDRWQPPSEQSPVPAGPNPRPNPKLSFPRPVSSAPSGAADCVYASRSRLATESSVDTRFVVRSAQAVCHGEPDFDSPCREPSRPA